MNPSSVIEEGIVFAGKLNGKGSVDQVDLARLNHAWDSEELMWIHMDGRVIAAQKWLEEHSRLHSVVIEGLLEQDTRPRAMVHEDGLLLISRGVNLNKGADPEDMIVLRIWIQNNNIITFRNEKSFIIEDLVDAFKAGKGPCNPGEFLVDILDQQLKHISQVVSAVEYQADILDEMSEEQHTLELHLKEIREQSLGLRRYLSPQRDVITHVAKVVDVSWLNKYDRMRLQELSDRTARYVEDLDFVRERALYMQDELDARNARKINEKLYMLALITTVFLPLHLIAGLMGANVQGIPYADSQYGFWIVWGILLSVAGGVLWFLKRRGWF